MERHHWIPLSLHGIDHGANIIPVSHELHLLIHNTMNYEYRVYTTAWRKFRRKHNHKVFCDVDMCQDILRMQKGYLDKWHKLPKVAQEMHFQKMNELCLFYDPYHRWDKNWKFLWEKYEIAYTSYHAMI